MKLMSKFDEADEQVLVHLGAEQFLESEVCVWVDVSVFEFPKFHEVVLFMGIVFVCLLCSSGCI